MEYFFFMCWLCFILLGILVEVYLTFFKNNCTGPALFFMRFMIVLCVLAIAFFFYQAYMALEIIAIKAQLET